MFTKQLYLDPWPLKNKLNKINLYRIKYLYFGIVNKLPMENHQKIDEFDSKLRPELS